MSLVSLLAGATIVVVSSPPAPAVATARSAELRWLVDLGAESLAASARGSVAARPFALSVPGAAYVLAVGPDGALQKRKRLAADASAPYGVAVTDAGFALANKEGSVELWSLSSGAEPSLRWTRSLGERATSLGWDGGDVLIVATWRNSLVALSAADGRVLWTVDIGGRAEAPPVIEGKDAFVATKANVLFHLDAPTGRVLWKVGLPGLVLHPPAVFAEPRLVVCGTWDGQLFAYRALTGQVRWSVTLPAKLAGAPLATPDLVAAVTADGAVQVYDPTGRMRWMQPGSSDGAATLLLPPGGPAPRLLVVSRMLVGLDLGNGARLGDYPRGAAEELRRRFADAMLEGVKTYSEGEKRALLEREAFDLSGPLFGPARLVGPLVAFGTEDGWAYLFEAAALRPLGRYHAGQPCSAAPHLTAGRVLAIAGEDVFGIDASTGRTVWTRALGAEAQRVVGDATLGLVAGGRVHALDPVDGLPRWSLRGRLRSVAPPASGQPGTTPWLADDGEGNLKALWPPGRLGEASLPAGGDLLPLLTASGSAWVAATREGRVLRVTWEEETKGAGGPSGGRLVTSWEKALDERLVDVRLAGERIAVRSEAGTLIGLGEAGQEMWRLRLSGEDRFEMVPEAGLVLITGAADLRIHDWTSGDMRLQWKVPSPVAGATVKGRFLLWVDRSGGAHRVDVEEGRLVETTNLGTPLAAATPTREGFLVTTTAGEVGLVKMEPGDPVAGDATQTAKRGAAQ